jgi:predicted acyltransferase
VPVRRIAGIFTNPIAQQIGAFGPLLSTGVALLVTWLVLAWMYKRKIFLRP